MEIQINFTGNKKMDAIFDDYVVKCDQPLDNDGDASAPSPFDYFLTSTALCAGYFVKAYCDSRNLSVEGIKLVQHNNEDPQKKYKQIFEIQIHFPSSFSQKDKDGIVRAIQGCSVKKTIQEIPEFKISVI
ncbi:MAG: hypothetical protein A2381_08265 [Bdellovibrionales bacterium RIFOXYB1_FULL_37_110]|nr:MAG: hypothetical protein A2417_06450 [Bdellovibrionales bacterium RIFOXYC1_FULL_37_79]OFZ60076.1 MAG: hypothetical protein A2381_08265 [Bdellovibrionales bacterium RIFOXYB1_FULL_37_110]OFZ64928.1 MAG: hypothetical protein A2577_02115 [Bdellovibrionales bacterium RIFOXYD1_FULL_36_51]